MKNTTDEFSFMLKPSEHGIGVFAVHDIKEDTYLRLFGDEKEFEHRVRIFKTNEVPELFLEYCMVREDSVVAPLDFGAMSVGWYLNHSKQSNAYHKNYHWYASRDIKEGEEILIDYNTLNESSDAVEDYYSK